MTEMFTHTTYPYGMDAIPVKISTRKVSTGISFTPPLDFLDLRLALVNSDYSCPDAAVQIHGGPFSRATFTNDLAVAVALLGEQHLFPIENLAGKMFLGLLERNGRVKKVRSVFASAMIARNLKIDTLVVSNGQGYEASLAGMNNIKEVGSLSECIDFLNDPIISVKS